MGDIPMNKTLLTTVSALSLFAFAGAMPATAQESKGETVIIKPQESAAESTTEKAGEAMEQAAETAGEAVEETAEAAGETAGTAGQKVEQAAESTGEAVEETAESAGEAVEEAGKTAIESAGEAVEEAGKAVEAAREAVEEAGEEATEQTAATEAVPEPEIEGDRMVQPEGTYLARDLIGRPVQNAEGENLADVESFVITPEGQITHVIVSFGGFLGLGEKQVLLAWEEFEIDPQEEVFFLSMSEEEIASLPELKTQKEKQREQEAAQATPSTGMGTATAPAQPTQ